jgi:hypothetical protein
MKQRSAAKAIVWRHEKPDLPDIKKHAARIADHEYPVPSQPDGARDMNDQDRSAFSGTRGTIGLVIIAVLESRRAYQLAMAMAKRMLAGAGEDMQWDDPGPSVPEPDETRDWSRYARLQLDAQTHGRRARRFGHHIHRSGSAIR